MIEHPLRETLTQEDWSRIQHAVDNEDFSLVSDDEVEAACDVMLDYICDEIQTHQSVLLLH